MNHVSLRGHSSCRVEASDHRYVIVCECGWVSIAADRAELVGRDWDHHRKVIRERFSGSEAQSL